MADAILVINAGSSSIKYSVFVNRRPRLELALDGFHGLSYEYIASALPSFDPKVQATARSFCISATEPACAPLKTA